MPLRTFALITGICWISAQALLAQGLIKPESAPLHSIQFVDKNEGWAVGDQGAIWHSIDGGDTWEQQKSGTRAHLRGLCFLTPYTGWVVGRAELSSSQASVGVVLHTQDGGLTWNELNRGVLPGLNGVHFQDEKNGVAWGDGSDAVPGGVFRTNDGGKSWQLVRGTRTGSWLAGTFPTFTQGCVVGLGGSSAMVTSETMTRSATMTPHPRTLRAIVPLGTDLLAAGDGGILVRSSDSGKTWQREPLPLSASAAACFDGQTLARFGKTILLAGSPGTVIFRSTDAGKTWDRIPTTWHWPIRGLTLLNETLGWGVSDFGTILKTTDGGKTWKVVRQTGTQAAVHLIQATPQGVPLDVVAGLSARDGYYSTVTTMLSGDALGTSSQALSGFRLSAAVGMVGGSSTHFETTYPVPDYLQHASEAELLAHWREQLDLGDQPLVHLARKLTCLIRMSQAEVILAEEISPGMTAGQKLVLQAARLAYEQAADKSQHPEQLTELGLPLVMAKKLYTLTTSPEPKAQASLDGTTFADRLLDSPSGFASGPSALLQPNPGAARDRRFALVAHRLPESESHTNIMTGITLAEGGPARRPAEMLDPAHEIVVADRRLAHSRKQRIETIIAAAQTPAAMATALAEVNKLLPEMPEDLAARTVLELARKMAHDGNHLAAREFFLLTTLRYSGSSEALTALRWLTRYAASAECRYRAEREGMLMLPRMATKPKSNEVQQAGYVEAPEQENPNSEALHATWARACLEFESQIGQYGSLYAREPGTVLTALAARRQLGLTGDVSKVVEGYFRVTPAAGSVPPGQDLWRDAIAAESWLTHASAVKDQPKPLALCPTTTIKPHLDGTLDDECWKLFQPLELKQNSGKTAGYTTYVTLAHDEEFLYVGLKCLHPEGKQQPKMDKRRRDENLSGFDRVDLMLDLDRDYQTYFRLQVDQRGAVAEDCWGDASWNPRWFVAVEPTSTGWTAELAIPLKELTARLPAPGTTWGMNITRVIPGQGVQRWSGPARTEPQPEAMGLLKIFSPKK